MLSTPEMVHSVDMLILADRRDIIEDISEQLEVYVGTVHKIVHNNLAFLEVSCWVSPGQSKVLYCSKEGGNH